MSDKIKIALLGLGEVGQTFAEHFLERIQTGRLPVEIVAVAHRDLESPVAMGFAQNQVPVFKDALEVLTLGEKVDIIFDLSGNSRVRQDLRLGLIERKNRHTVIAPEVMAKLLWYLFDESDEPRTEAQVAC
jgi:homoserine dehydrogenase